MVTLYTVYSLSLLEDTVETDRKRLNTTKVVSWTRSQTPRPPWHPGFCLLFYFVLSLLIILPNVLPPPSLCLLLLIQLRWLPRNPEAVPQRRHPVHPWREPLDPRRQTLRLHQLHQLLPAVLAASRPPPLWTFFFKCSALLSVSSFSKSERSH